MKLYNSIILQNNISLFLERDLPFKTAYKFSRLQEKISKDQEFYNRQLQRVIEKYSEKDEKGMPIVVDNDQVKIIPECVKIAEQEVIELRDTEVDDINVFFTLDEFEGLEIKPSELQGLLPFIIEE